MKTKIFNKDQGYKHMEKMIHILNLGICSIFLGSIILLYDILIMPGSLMRLFTLLIFIINFIILLIFRNGLNAMILHIKHLDFFNNS